MSRTVAITGINGYLASPLLPILQSNSEVDRIIGIDINPWKGGFDKVHFFKEDTRSQNISEILKDVDTVFHLGLIGAGTTCDNKEEHDVNVNGTKNIFQACVKNDVRKVICASSIAVYGADKDGGIKTEASPLIRNNGDYYNEHKLEVEDFVKAFSTKNPEIIATVLRLGIPFGPRQANALYADRLLKSVNDDAEHSATLYQLIHEQDLGQALFLAQKHDLPGAYNVAADDAVQLPASDTSEKGDTASPKIVVKNEKFKKATGWRPGHSSEDTFREFIKARSEKVNRTPTQEALTGAFKSQKLSKAALDEVGEVYKHGHVPGEINEHPWMDPKLNSLSYLPINQTLSAQEQVLPKDVLHRFIDESKHRVIMDLCPCRTANTCENFTNEIACMFMGESALSMPPGVSRIVTKEEAHAHVERGVSVGLTPIVGKARVDNDIFQFPDESKLLSVCFCCHCCCMMGAYKHMSAKQLDEVMPPVEGVEVRITDNCNGCGACVEEEICRWDAITMENGKAIISDICRRCGRCESFCPVDGAITINLENPRAIEDVTERIRKYVKVDS